MHKEINKILKDSEKLLEKCEYDKAKAVLLACKLYPFEEDAYIQLAYVLFKLSDYISAEKIYEKIAKYYDTQRKKNPFDIMIGNSLLDRDFCKELKEDTTVPLYKKLSDRAKSLIQAYDGRELSEEIQQVLAEDFNSILNDLTLYNELKSYWESHRSSYSLKGCKLRNIVTGETGQYMDTLTCLEKSIKKLTPKEKTSMIKLNELLLWEQYPLKTREEYFGALYNGARENIYFIRSKKYFADQKYALALDKLKTARSLYLERNWRRAIMDESKGTYLFHLVPRDFKVIEQIEMFSSLDEIMKLKNLHSIKEEIEEINHKILLRKRKKSSENEKKGILGIFMAHEKLFDDLHDIFPGTIPKTTLNCITALNQAFNFNKVNYDDLSRLSDELVSKDLINVKKFVDSVINFCFHLQKYSNMEDAIKDEKELLKDFHIVGDCFHEALQNLRDEITKGHIDIKEDAAKQHKEIISETTTAIKKAIKEPVQSEDYNTNYRITIKQDMGKKGTLVISFESRDYIFPLTPTQLFLMIALANKLKSDKKLTPNKQGWLSCKSIIDAVESWGSTTDVGQVRTQIDRIRKKIDKKRLREDIIQTQGKIGYRISTHPANITIK